MMPAPMGQVGPPMHPAMQNIPQQQQSQAQQTELKYDNVAKVKTLIWSLKDSLAMEGRLPYTKAGPSVNSILESHMSNDQLQSTTGVQLSSTDDDQSSSTDDDQSSSTDDEQSPTTDIDQPTTSETDLLTTYEIDQLPSASSNVSGTGSKGRTKISQVLELYNGGAINFCLKYGLLSKEIKCPCGSMLKICALPEEDKRVLWRCKNGHKKRLSVRKGSFFANSQLSIPDILYITYMWVYSFPYTFILHETGYSRSSIFNWCFYCNEMCFRILEQNSQQLGGPDKMVEISEAVLKKTKENHGRSMGRLEREKQVKDQCVLVGTEEHSNKYFVVIVPDWKKDTLLTIIKKHVLPGTTISSDCWNSCKSLGRNSFVCLFEKYRLKFYDKKKGFHIDSVDNMLHLVKRSKPSSCLRKKEHLVESLYKKLLGLSPDPFIKFLTDVTKVSKATEAS